MSLSQLKAPKGANRVRTRVGRGQASGLGKTAGRGGKGQKARTGNMRFEGFEGGQMPLQRRLPKFGFKNVFRRDLDEVQVSALGVLPAGAVVDQAALADAGLARRNADGVVVLGKGDLVSPYTVRADRVTAGARAAIEKAGGKVELLPKLQTMGEKARAARSAERAAKVAARPKAAPKAAPAGGEGKPEKEKKEKKEKPEKAEKAEKKDKKEKKQPE